MNFSKLFSGFFTLVVCTLLYTSCVTIQEVKIGNVRNVEVKGLNNNVITIDLMLPVENPNNYRLKVTDANLKVTSGNKEFGKVKQMSDLTISKKSSKTYPVRVGIELTNVNDGLLSSLWMISMKSLDLRLSGSIKVKSLFYRKTFVLKELKISN